MQNPSLASVSRFAAYTAARVAATPLGRKPPPASGAIRAQRRLRLWELPPACHCALVGVCLPLDVLRRLAGKALGGKVLADDHSLHAGAVGEARSRNRLSKLLQQELDQRYARLVHAFQPVKSPEDLTQRWLLAVEEGDMAGAFWAALTHRHSNSAVQERLCRDMHMLQHQAGAQVRDNREKQRALLEENAVLTRELGRAQQRCTRLLAEKAADNQRLQEEVAQLRHDHVRQAQVIAQQANTLQALQQAVPELEARLRLQQRLHLLQQRQQEDAARIRQLQQELVQGQHKQEPAGGSRGPGSLPGASVQPPEQVGAGDVPEPMALEQQTVLCVGGRNANLSSYRSLIEQTGGKFAHHDGGLEHSCALLDTSLAAADLVICQTGCISHNAYWRVKDFCKRTGKRCVFVANPSVSSLARSLKQARLLSPALLEKTRENERHPKKVTT